MSPFVVAPQTKKLAVRSQNVDVREREREAADRSAERVLLHDRRVVDDGAERPEPDLRRAVAQEEERRAAA